MATLASARAVASRASRAAVAPPRRRSTRLPARPRAVGEGVLGEGWTPSHVDIFADSPETRALVSCDLLTLRPCELVPELPMYLVDGEDILELWQRTEAFAASRGARADPDPDGGLHPPYWAVPWVGGQGVARYVLDHPETVAGKSVLDVGSGCGVAALAAAKAGASLVCANDIDPLAAVAFMANAEACGLTGEDAACVLETSVEDMLRRSPEDVARFDVIMAGDVCFMKGLSEAFQTWLASVGDRKEGAVTILGDPSRQAGWAPRAGWAEGTVRAAEYEVETAATNALTEGQRTRRTVVWLRWVGGDESTVE